MKEIILSEEKKMREKVIGYVGQKLTKKKVPRINENNELKPKNPSV